MVTATAPTITQAEYIRRFNTALREYKAVSTELEALEAKRAEVWKEIDQLGTFVYENRITDCKPVNEQEPIEKL